jgi:hypothetical protein
MWLLAAVVVAVCCTLASWLLRTRKILVSHELGVEQVCPEPSQPAAVQSSVRARYTVFISHAGAQKNFALWVRNHIRVGGYQAFVDERDLRCGFLAPVLICTPEACCAAACPPQMTRG